MLTEKLAKLNNVSQHSISTALVIIFTIALYGWIVSPHVTNLYAVQRYENVVDDVGLVYLLLKKQRNSVAAIYRSFPNSQAVK